MISQIETILIILRAKRPLNNFKNKILYRLLTRLNKTTTTHPGKYVVQWVLLPTSSRRDRVVHPYTNPTPLVTLHLALTSKSLSPKQLTKSGEGKSTKPFRLGNLRFY